MEVLRRFANSSQFKRFAMSKYGLSLSSYEVGNIIEDSKSVEERNLEMLWLWKHKNEEIATTQRVQKLVDDFLNESSDDESEEDEPGACGGVPLFEPQSTRVPEFNKATEHNISTVNTTEKQTDEKKDMKTHESNESDEVNEFKRIVNLSTKNTVTYSFKRKNLATIDFDVSPETRKIDFYGTTVKETEYKPELGFSQQTQHQPGLGCKRENFFQSPVEAAIHRVVIIGGAGYGKTEMLNGYAGDVMDQNIPLLAKVEVVLHRNFRDLEVHGKISPGKFLFGHLDMSDDITEVGVDWIRKNPSKFLLVLDGADQYSLPDQLGKHSRNINHTQEADPKLILNSILSGDLFPGIYILYSSREHAIRFFEGKTRAQKVIALAGFNKENVEKLVRGFSGERTDEIMSHLEMNSPQLLSLCSIPMFLIFTVTILLRYKDKKPETLTEVLMLVLQDSFKSEHITIDQSKTGLTIYDVMNKLKEMSYNGTKNKRVTFTKSDLPNGLTAEHFKDILITIPGSVGENQKLVEGHFIFLMQHQSLQEALTALFIAEMSLRKFKRFVSDQLYEPHWVVVRRILFGVIVNPKTSKLAAGIDSKVGIFQGRNVEEKKQILLSSIKQLAKPGWFKRKYKKIKRVQDEELVELIHTVNECGEAAKNVIKSSFQKINILDSFLTRSDVFALSSVVGRCSFIQELKVHLSIDDLEVMCSVFERCNVKIKRMILQTNLATGVVLYDYEAIQITGLLPCVMELLVINCCITSCKEMFQEKLNALPDSNLQIISNLGGHIWLELRPGSSNEMLDGATYEILKKDLILLED
uniref:uncharacterized protein LOC120344502 n=1 Tax=Styela clava TaxID=7725 RepID=UPI001939C6E4|nr:uncharacterized protein LOC120344502 [Styela clava]